MSRQVTLRLKEQPSVPVEAESITPENLSGKTREQIYQLPLLAGNRQKTIEEYFEVEIHPPVDQSKEEINEGDPAKIILIGDLTRFKRLGQGMTRGEMEIQGSVGFHTGSLMTGGIIMIKGNAGDWLGAHMTGGQITVEGSAGNYVGAAYRGRIEGMFGGSIIIKGNVGQMVGSRMRRGLIAVGGNCTDVPGFKMLAGTIVIAGTAGIRSGANMKRGTIIFLKPADLLPSFYYNCTYQPQFWGLLQRDLQKKGFQLDDSYQNAFFKRYSGDANEGGKGEILICQLS